MAVILQYIQAILTWLQSSAGAMVIQIILEIISYLQSKPNMEDAAKEMLAHVKKISKPQA